jgi:phosphoribosyl-ATP pyrophosphohydrolase/phosphoribosyl-AMP cyclohydrolase
MKFDEDKIDFEKLSGIVPAVVQDSKTKAVLMVGFMNKEALRKTISSNKVTFFSRTKKRLWQKGEESGNTLELLGIEKDCDNDTLLIQARPTGPTCHTGGYSCFANQTKQQDFLAELSGLISKRKIDLPKESYTASLFEEGMEKIIAKVKEESDEVIVAAREESDARLAEESGDLIYHLLILLAERNVDYDDVISVLKKRNGKMNSDD